MSPRATTTSRTVRRPLDVGCHTLADYPPSYVRRLPEHALQSKTLYRMSQRQRGFTIRETNSDARGRMHAATNTPSNVPRRTSQGGFELLRRTFRRRDHLTAALWRGRRRDGRQSTDRHD